MKLTSLFRSATAATRDTPRASSSIAPVASPAASPAGAVAATATSASNVSGMPGAQRIERARASVAAGFKATRERFSSLLGLSRPKYARQEARPDRRALVETEWRSPLTRANKFGRPFPARDVRRPDPPPARPTDPEGDWGTAGNAAPAPGASASAQRRAAKAHRTLAKAIGKFTSKPIAKPAGAGAGAAKATAAAAAAEHDRWLDHRDGLDSWVYEHFGASAGEGGEADGATSAELASVLAEAAPPEEVASDRTNDGAAGASTAAARGAASPSDRTPRFAPSLMLGYAVLSALGPDDHRRALAALRALPEVVRIDSLAQRAAAFDPAAANVGRSDAAGSAVAPMPVAPATGEEDIASSAQITQTIGVDGGRDEPRASATGRTNETARDSAIDSGNQPVQTTEADEHARSRRISSTEIESGRPSLVDGGAAGSGDAGSADRAHKDAWCIARSLATTHWGFDLLKTLTGGSASGAESAAAHALLQAWDRMPEPHADLDAALAAAHASTDDGGNLAPRVLRAVSGSTQPRDVAALYAWRQGFRSDAPGSELKQVQTRLHRFVTRGMLRLDKTNWFFQRMFGRKKSALRGMMLGTPSASQASYAKEAAKYAAALKSACASLAAALRSERLADTANASAREAAAAALDALAARPAEHIGQLEVDEATMAALEGRDPVLGAADRDEAPPLLDIGALRACAKQFRVHRWEQVKAALARVDEIGEAKALKPERLSRDEIKRVLHQLVADIQQSTQVSFADGGRFGFSTRGLSLAVRKLHHHLPVGGELALAHFRSSRAIVTLQRQTAGFEIFVGTERGTRGEATLGGRIGYSKRLSWLCGLRLGGSLRLTPFDRDLRKPRGVLIRVARERLVDDSHDWVAMKYDDARVTAAAQDLVDFLFDEASEPVRGAGAETSLFERLAARIGDRHDISIGWQDTRTEVRRQSVQGSLGASMSAPTSSARGAFGLEGSMLVDLGSRGDTAIRETSGSLRYDRRTVSSGARVSLQGTAGVGPSWDRGDLTGSLPGASLLGIGGAQRSRLVGARLALAERDGKMLNRACYADEQFTSFNAFAAAVETSRDEWIEMYRNNHGCSYPEASAKLKYDLDLLKMHHRLNQTFLVRRRLKLAAARRADAYRALDRMHDAAAASMPARRGRADWSRPLDAMLRERASWLPERIAVSEVTGRVRSSPGLRLPIGGVATESVLAQRELMRSK